MLVTVVIVVAGTSIVDVWVIVTTGSKHTPETVVGTTVVCTTWLNDVVVVSVVISVVLVWVVVV